MLKGNQSCFKGEWFLVFTEGKFIALYKKKLKTWSWYLEKKRSNQSGMKYNVADKSWRQDHRNRCGTRPGVKYRCLASLFFWMFFSFQVVQVKVCCDCPVTGTSVVPLMPGDPHFWPLSTDCPWSLGSGSVPFYSRALGLEQSQCHLVPLSCSQKFSFLSLPSGK